MEASRLPSPLHFLLHQENARRSQNFLTELSDKVLYLEAVASFNLRLSHVGHPHHNQIGFTPSCHHGRCHEGGRGSNIPQL